MEQDAPDSPRKGLIGGRPRPSAAWFNIFPQPDCDPPGQRPKSLYLNDARMTAFDQSLPFLRVGTRTACATWGPAP